ncbi:cytochrome P450 [Colletotrichum zoysiae]|uniref:Cytochrome P450 n=1 Tax=Colletotrichum zoysiae TaxID=1216348 RepID=A0AAD9M1E0_9PEZI|nr:cytochrome P450 [Colletotrichum zoysiae]
MSLFVLVAIATTLSTLSWSKASRTLHFPFIGSPSGNTAQKRQYFISNAVKLFQEGYQNRCGTACPLKLLTNFALGELLVVPLPYADELRKQPEEIISRDVANNKSFETKLLNITFATPLMVHTVKADLTHNIPHLTSPMMTEAQETLREAFGESPEYSAVSVYQKLLRVVAIVSGIAFVGPETCRENEYLTNSIMFTVDLFSAIAELKKWPNWGPTRRIASYFIPQVKKMKDHRARSMAYLVPVIQKRRSMRFDSKEDKPKDMLQWLIEKSDKFGAKQDEDIAMVLILLGVAAIHTTTMAVTQTLYDLIGYCPEVIPELREEIRSVQAAHNGVLNTEALYQMKLLDSIMRESQRLNPTNVMRMQRCVLQSFQLADGTTIPAGVDIAVPALPVNLDESKYPDPLRFDPHRFVRLRSSVDPDPIGYASREQYQFISVTKENMAFGFGKPACPGRFFAATEMKLLLIRLLQDYDIKMPDGVEGRYPNMIRGTSITPDTSKTIMMRRRL